MCVLISFTFETEKWFRLYFRELQRDLNESGCQDSSSIVVVKNYIIASCTIFWTLFGNLRFIVKVKIYFYMVGWLAP